jgi:hypothetical protein
MSKDKKAIVREKANEKLDLRAELDRLDAMIADLKKQYEMYFTGLLPLAPEKPHAEVKRKIRELLKAPFKTPAFSFRLKTLEGRYSTFNTYWQRTLKQREEGTYSKDVFKANIREKQAAEDTKAETAVGKAEKSMNALFESYKDALEKTTGKKQNLDYQAFQKSLIERAREFKASHADKKVGFKVVMKDGKVTIQANLRDKK